MLNDYKECRNTILVASTESLIEVHKKKKYWSPVNSGYSKRSPAKRDRSAFILLGREPKLKHGEKRKKIMEITIRRQVLDIEKHVKCVVEVRKGEPPTTIYSPTKFSDNLAMELHNSTIE